MLTFSTRILRLALVSELNTRWCRPRHEPSSFRKSGSCMMTASCSDILRSSAAMAAFSVPGQVAAVGDGAAHRLVRERAEQQLRPVRLGLLGGGRSPGRAGSARRPSSSRREGRRCPPCSVPLMFVSLPLFWSRVGDLGGQALHRVLVLQDAVPAADSRSSERSALLSRSRSWLRASSMLLQRGHLVDDGGGLEILHAC